MEWFNSDTQAVTQELGTDQDAGLSGGEAQSRLSQYGPNELVERGAKSPWVIFLAQFKEIMVIILIVAAAVSLFLGEYIDTVVILAIVILNAILGFTQEYRAEQAMAALKKMAVPTVRVRRNGEITEISSTQVVPGDIVLLEAGNLVPADGRIVDNVNLKVQEAALTGESEPVTKTDEALDADSPQVGDQRNMVFMGTVVTYGRGAYAVTATGMSTELGKIAELLQDVGDEMTPLQKRLAQLGKALAAIALVIIGIVVVTGYFRGDDLETLLLTGISLAVAAIPESLPAVVTVTLALGSQRLLKRNALIRRLPAVETLGSVTTICSDKTGTLTENRMTVTMLDVAGNQVDINTVTNRQGTLLKAGIGATETPAELNAMSVLFRVGALCNDAVLKEEPDGSMRAIGDPTEGALVLAAHSAGFDLEELYQQWPRVGEVPFTSERKRMTTVNAMNTAIIADRDVPWDDVPYVRLTKGAVDGLLDICTQVLVDDEFVPLDDAWKERIVEANAKLAQAGQRVLGIAIGLWEDEELPEDLSLLETEEMFIGMVAMIDPPRAEVEPAVLTALEAGIRPIMITGDHPLTAQRIAQDLHITDNDNFITGRQLADMPMPELKQKVEDVSVFARVAPEHKLNIVQSLQEKGEIVAMTGDGVNDAPALKRADIGVAMGITGTDVSKESADMVLLDDNFATIVAAVEEGRTIYDNIRKFIKYVLSSNTGEIIVMLIGPFLGMPLPLLPLQILWINLVTDGLPGLALSVEESERGVMKRSPYKPSESVFSRGVGPMIIWVGTLMGLLSLGVGYVYWLNDPDGPWQTMVFTTLVFAQMGNAMATRANQDSLLSIGVFRNRLMNIAILIGILLQFALIYIGFLQGIFETEPLSVSNLLVCVAVSLIVPITIETYKWVKRRRAAA